MVVAQQYLPFQHERNSSCDKQKPKILCLGVSFADLEGQLSRLQKDKKEKIFADCRDGSVQSVINSVRRKLLTEMDGRDLARCISTEKVCGVDVYTVSQEKGAVYREDRHIDANFNRHDFVRTLRNRFGNICCFDEIILDYFWIPQGWDANHWTKSFFENTLVALAAENMLHETGAIYLPFCLHCFKSIHACFDKLKQYYNVSFIRKNDLHKLSLWRGTQSIDAFEMQHFLGKNLNQEEVYCTFGPKDIAEAMDDPTISKQDLVKLAESLEDFHSIRFLCLKLLSGKRPATTKETCGSYIGCIDPLKVKRGFYNLRGSSTFSLKDGDQTAWRNSLSCTRSRRNSIISNLQSTPIKRVLFPTRKRKRFATVSDSSVSNSSNESAKITTRPDPTTIQGTPEIPVTPIANKTQLCERVSNSKSVHGSTSNNSSQNKALSSDVTPLLISLDPTMIPYITDHRYPTRQRKNNLSAAFIAPVRVVTPEATESSDSNKEIRNHTKCKKSRFLSPRNLFMETSSDKIQRICFTTNLKKKSKRRSSL